jgi:hypothetical protein
MLDFMLLLYAVVAIALLIQYKIYGHSPHNEVDADTFLTDECASTLQTELALIVEAAV